MGNLLRPDEVGAAWLENARDWPVSALPVYRQGDEAYIETGGYGYMYFSPYRPANFIGGQYDHVLVASTEQFHDFIFTRRPLPLDRICAWQLIPANNDAWLAAVEELGSKGAYLPE